MSWYYAENNERRGPVDDAAFDALVKAGTVRPDSLVWREGMPAWTPLADANYRPATTEAAAPTSEGGVEMGMCSESGRILPRSELVELDGRLVSAEYKHVVLQRIREGVSATGSAEDAEQIALRIRERDWDISANSCLSRAWALVRSRFWLVVGTTFIIYLIVAAAGIIPVVGPLAVQGPLFGGLYWMLLKLLRGQNASMEDAFQGFSRGWGHLVGVTVVTGLVAVAAMLPGFILMGAGGAMAARSGEPLSSLSAVGVLLIFAGLPVTIYFVVGWVFALPLVVDKQMEFWPALKLSRAVVGMHWWRIFWLLFFVGLVMMSLFFLAVVAVSIVFGLAAVTKDTTIMVSVGILLGFTMLCGFFTLLPLVFSTLVVAYEDIFGSDAPR